MTDADKITEILSLDEDGSKALLNELVGIFTTSAPLRIKRMAESLDHEDLKTLRAEAHALRSSSFALGAMKLARHCANIEQVEGVTLKFLREEVSKVSQEYEQVKTELMSLL